MKLFRFPGTRVPDEEYIAKLRRSMAWWDRWRFWLILLHVGLLAATIWVFSKGILVLMALAQPDAPLALRGFVAGMVIGITFGSIIGGIIYSLVSLVGGLRAERLLLKHLDAPDSQQSESHQSPQQQTRNH